MPSPAAIRLLLIPALILASCKEDRVESDASLTEESRVQDGSKILAAQAPATPRQALPKFVPDLEAEASAYFVAWAKHHQWTPEKQEECRKFEELYLKAQKIDEEAAAKIKMKYSLGPICGYFPSVEDFVGSLERDKQLQLLTSAINNHSKDENNMTREQRHENRSRYLAKRLQNYIDHLPVEKNRHKEGSKALLEFIDSQ